MIRQAQQRVQRPGIVLREALPSERLIERSAAADFLINFDNTTSNATPSKLIDYAMTGRPILSFNDRTFDPDGFRAALRGDYRAQVRGIDLSQYDIRNVAAQFIDLIDARETKGIGAFRPFSARLWLPKLTRFRYGICGCTIYFESCCRIVDTCT